MDYTIHNIKTFVCLAPKKHTAHKTMRALCFKHNKAFYRVYKSPPDKCSALCGLLNVNLMAVDFTNYRKADRRFSFYGWIQNSQTAIFLLTAWQGYIAKYP